MTVQKADIHLDGDGEELVMQRKLADGTPLTPSTTPAKGYIRLSRADIEGHAVIFRELLVCDPTTGAVGRMKIAATEAYT